MERLSKVILKADDRGNQLPVSEGIDELVRRGLLTDVAVIIQFTGEKERDTLLDAIDESPLRNEPGIGIELHVNFNTGKPVSDPREIPSLVDGHGILHHPNPTASAWEQYSRTLVSDHVRRELNAQIERYYQLFGHYPHALDSHNMILAIPPGDQIAIELAMQLHIPVTIPKHYIDNPKSGPWFLEFRVDQDLLVCYKTRGIVTADWEEVEQWNRLENLDDCANRLIQVMGSVREGITSFYFHPGHSDYLDRVGEDYDRGRFIARVRDFQILTHPKVIDVVRSLNLTSYRQLFYSQQHRSPSEDES